MFLIHISLTLCLQNPWAGKGDCIEHFGVSRYTVLSSANKVNVASTALYFKNELKKNSRMMLDLQKVKIVSIYQKVPKYHAYCYKLECLLYF